MSSPQFVQRWRCGGKERICDVDELNAVKADTVTQRPVLRLDLIDSQGENRGDDVYIKRSAWDAADAESANDRRLRHSSYTHSFGWRSTVRLAFCRTDTRAGAATDARTFIVHHHDLLFNLVVLIVVASEINKSAIIAEALEDHDLAAAHFVATAAADTSLGIDRDEKVRLPGAAVARCL